MKNLNQFGTILMAIGLSLSLNVMAEDEPINCATAEGDIRSLNAEKSHTAGQIAAGIGAITPIGLFVHAVKGDSKKNAKIASGDYNKMLDDKIAKIKKQCDM